MNHMEKQTENQKPDLSVAKLADENDLLRVRRERCAGRSLAELVFTGKSYLEAIMTRSKLFRLMRSQSGVSPA